MLRFVRALILVVACSACSGGSFAVAPADTTDAAHDTAATGGGDTGSSTGTDSAPAADAIAGESGTVDAGPSTGGCTKNTDCGTGHYCRIDSCGATGACVGMPLGAGVVYAPICGCDGITYWSSVVAGAYGQGMQHDGPCAATDTTVSTCTGSTCGDGTCVHQLASMSVCLSGTVAGTCWRIPGTTYCGMSAGPSVALCDGGSCKSMCEAIRANKAFYPKSCTP